MADAPRSTVALTRHTQGGRSGFAGAASRAFRIAPHHARSNAKHELFLTMRYLMFIR